MKRWIFSFLFLLLAFFVYPQLSKVHAAPQCYLQPSIFTEEDNFMTLTIGNAYVNSINDFEEVEIYCAAFVPTWPIPEDKIVVKRNDVTDLGGGAIQITIQNQSPIIPNTKCWRVCNNWTTNCHRPGVTVIKDKVLWVDPQICETSDIPVVKSPPKQCTITVEPDPPEPNTEYKVTVTNIDPNATGVMLQKSEDWVPIILYKHLFVPVFNCGDITKNACNVFGTDQDKHVALVVTGNVNSTDYNPGNPLCHTEFVVGKVPTTGGFVSPDICKRFIPPGKAQDKCLTCHTKKPPGVFTPFGCIDVEPQKFVTAILRIAIGLAGGIAFLMIIYGGFVIMTSSGNPERINSGKEIITSSLAGLFLIVFSVIILRIIGVDILGIPGLD